MATSRLKKNEVSNTAAISASLSNYRQSPRKTRLVADLIKGKTVADALTTLSFTDKRAAQPLKKLIESAYASAVASGSYTKDTLVIGAIAVDKGVVLKRFMPRARGSAARIKKRSSHVSLRLVPKALS